MELSHLNNTYRKGKKKSQNKYHIDLEVIDNYFEQKADSL